jgi:hypothetical protein
VDWHGCNWMETEQQRGNIAMVQVQVPLSAVPSNSFRCCGEAACGCHSPLDAAVMWKLCLGEPADLTHKKYARAGLEPRTFFSRVACQAHRATKAWFGLAFFTRVPVATLQQGLSEHHIGHSRLL